MEFGKYLVLSTAHLRCSTGELLDHWGRVASTERPLTVAPTDHGWFLPTWPVTGEAAAQLPVELPAILAFAREHDCAHILLDCDGPRVPQLPDFPW